MNPCARSTSVLSCPLAGVVYLLSGESTGAEPGDIIAADPETNSRVELLPGDGFKCLKSRTELADGAVLELKDGMAHGQPPTQSVKIILPGKGIIEGPVIAGEITQAVVVSTDKTRVAMILTYAEGIGGWYSCMLLAEKSDDRWKFTRVLAKRNIEEILHTDLWYESLTSLEHWPRIECVKCTFGKDGVVCREKGEVDSITGEFKVSSRSGTGTTAPRAIAIEKPK